MNEQDEDPGAFLPGQSPAKAMAGASRAQAELAICANEDLVRKRYNRVMGVSSANEGWRSAMSEGVRNVSSSLEYLRHHSHTHLNQSELRRKPSQDDAAFAQMLLTQDQWRTDAVKRAKTDTSDKGRKAAAAAAAAVATTRHSKQEKQPLKEEETGDAVLSPMAAKILKRRGHLAKTPMHLPAVNRFGAGRTAAAASAAHRKANYVAKKPRPRKVFPEWLWFRPDFQSVYQKPAHELCLDTLQKPGAERASYELEELAKWLSEMRLLHGLDHKLKLELLRVASLEVRPKGVMLYLRRDPVRRVYMIRSGVIQLSNLDGKPTGTTIRISSSDSCGFAQETAAQNLQKKLRRLPPSSRRWYQLRQAFNPKNDNNVPDPQTAGQEALDAVAREGAIHRDTAQTLSDCVLLSLPYLQYTRLIAEYRARELSQIFRFLSSLRMFARWSNGRIRRLAGILGSKTYTKRQKVFDQGNAADHLFLVFDGQISLTRQVVIERRNEWPASPTTREIVQTKQTKSFVVDVVAENDFFGEEAVLGVRRCPTTAVCLSEKATLLYLKRKHFIYLAHEPTMLLFQRRRNEAQEFAFFKVYSSLSNIRGIDNLHSIDVLDEESLALTPVPANVPEEGSAIDSFRSSPRSRGDLTDRGGLLSSPALSRGSAVTRMIESTLSQRQLRRMSKGSQSLKELHIRQEETDEEKTLRRQRSEQVLERLSKPKDDSLDTSTIIALRHHLSALLGKREHAKKKLVKKK